MNIGKNNNLIKSKKTQGAITKKETAFYLLPKQIASIKSLI